MITLHNTRFTKNQRLSGHTVIRNLFEHGASYFHFPFRVIVVLTPFNEEVPIKLLISVSKKNLKKAVHRNKAKRIIRECFRINQHLAIDELKQAGISLIIGLVYTPKELPGFNQTNSRMVSLLSHLTEKARALANRRATEGQSGRKISETHTESQEKPLIHPDPSN